MANTKQRKTEVKSGAKHKITYEWRSLLGIIGSWHELLKEKASGTQIVVSTTTDDIDEVLVLTPTKNYTFSLTNPNNSK